MIAKTNGFLEEYYQKCKSGEIIVGRELLTELGRLIEDLENPRYIYNTQDADERLDFIENCIRLTKAPFYAKPMKLLLFQKAFISALYGFKMADSGFDRFKKAVFLLARKNGKALDLNTRIPTPKGDKTMRDIQEGDYVFNEKGKPTKVLKTSEVFKNRPCYEITFEDGEKIVADENHKWTVQTKEIRSLLKYKPTSSRKRRAFCNIDQYGCVTLTTIDMLNDFAKKRADGKGLEYKYRVPVPKPVQYSKKKLFSPYTLGLWLGDGSCGDNRIHTDKDDLETLLSELKKEKIDVASVKLYTQRTCEVRIGKKTGYHKHDVREKLRELGVWENKHIPEQYFYGSVEQRLDLLRGLMDTDGTVSKHGQCGFTQKNKRLADGVSRLLTSLGIKHNVRKKLAKYNGKDFEAYEICFFVDKKHSCFRYARKTARLKDKLHSRMNYKSIIGIKRVENRETKCIMVDNPRGLFLCGEKNTVTHNSELCSALALAELILGQDGSDIVLSSNDDSQAEILYQATDTMRVMIDPKSQETWRNQKGIKCFANGNKIFKLTNRQKNKEGRNISFGVLDEVHEQTDNTILKSIEQSQSLKENPKLIIITTEGFVKDGVLDQLLSDCRKILNGEDDGISAERTLPWLYTQDGQNEIWQNEKSWVKSNPTLGSIKKWDYLREQIDLARKNKSDRVFVMSKDFNEKQNSSQSWLNLEDYDYKAVYNLEDFMGCTALGAVDLSETTDLTCAKILMMKPGDKTKYIHTKYFIPESKLENSDDRNAGAKYKEWAQAGLITISEGNDIDLSLVADWFYSLYKEYNIKLWKCGYDQKFAKDFLNRMDYYGWSKSNDELVMIIQNAQSLSNAIKLLEADLTHRLVNFNDNEVDKWCLKNACLKVNDLSQCLIVKSEPNSRIDGAVCKAILYEMYRQNRTEWLQMIGEV